MHLLFAAWLSSIALAGTQGDLKAAAKLLEAGQLAEADAAYTDVLTELEAKYGAESDELVVALLGRGDARFNGGDQPGAARDWLRAVVIRQEQALKPKEVEPFLLVLKNLGGLLYSLGDYGTAYEVLQLGESYVDRGGTWDAGLIAGLYSNLALVRVARGDMLGADAAIRESSRMYDLAYPGDSEPVELGGAYANYGYIYYQSGDLEQALVWFEASLRVFEHHLGPDAPNTLQARYNVATMADSAGDTAKARITYQAVYDSRRAQALPLDTTDASILGSIGSAALRVGDHDEAARSYLAAVDLFREQASLDHDAARLILPWTIAVLDQVGRTDDARALASEWLATTEAAFPRMAGLATDRERADLVESRRAALDTWLATRTASDDATEGYDAVLRWKGVTARAWERQRGAVAAAHEPELAHKHARLDWLRGNIGQLAFASDIDAQLVDAWVSERDTLERELAQQSWYHQRDTLFDSASTTEVCAALSEGAVLVEWVVAARFSGDDDLFMPSMYAYVLDQRECALQRITVDSIDELGTAIGSWHGKLSSPDATTARIDRTGKRLAQTVWAPIQAVLDEPSELVLAPSSALSWIPFGALPMSDGYLIERYPITYVDSGRALVAAVALEPKGSGAVVLGGLDYGQPRAESECQAQRFDPLPGSAVEREAVVRTLGDKTAVTALSDKEAMEGTVRQALTDARYLHLATHGFLVPVACSAEEGWTGAEEARRRSPMASSGIALSLANEGAIDLDHWDGLLTGEEVAALDLRQTELAVLSACQTGVGAATRGEGVQGLRRAFLMAGVKNLVSSLWQVDDAATSTLMQSMWRAIIDDGQAPSAALRTAQLELLEANRRDRGEARPQDWAAFIVSGAP